jgi:hypothetical protein
VGKFIFFVIYIFVTYTPETQQPSARPAQEYGRGGRESTHSLDEVGNKVCELHRGGKKGITTGEDRSFFQVAKWDDIEAMLCSSVRECFGMLERHEPTSVQDQSQILVSEVEDTGRCEGFVRGKRVAKIKWSR